MWTLMIVAVLGGFATNDLRMYSISFNNKEACLRAAKEAKSSSSSQMGYICISQDTGETIKP